MPNIKSAKKRVLIAEVRNARNKAAKSELKTAIKKFEAAAAEGNRTEADGAYKVAVKKVDQAVAKGILHKNTAAHIGPKGHPFGCPFLFSGQGAFPDSGPFLFRRACYNRP